MGAMVYSGQYTADKSKDDNSKYGGRPKTLTQINKKKIIKMIISLFAQFTKARSIHHSFYK